jgi:predicted DNA-binding ribbon-helix-helix protein
MSTTIRTTISINRTVYNNLNAIASKNSITVQKLLEIIANKIKTNEIEIKL